MIVFKNHPEDGRFVWYKLLLITSQIKRKSKIFNIGVHCSTRRHVPPVIKSIFIIRTLTPNCKCNRNSNNDFKNHQSDFIVQRKIMLKIVL